MSKFKVNVTFDLNGGEQEPELSYHSFPAEDVEEYEDNSYFQSTTLEASGGDLSFVVEADSEEEAEEIAQGVVREGDEVEDGNSWTWVVENATYDIEKVEEPMTEERAREILDSVALTGDVGEAVEFILDALHTATVKVESQQAQIDALVENVKSLEAKVANLMAVINGQQAS